MITGVTVKLTLTQNIDVSTGCSTGTSNITIRLLTLNSVGTLGRLLGQGLDTDHHGNLASGILDYTGKKKLII